MFCSKCGNTLAAGAQFCNRCGTPVAAGGPQFVSASGPVSLERPTVITILAILHFLSGAAMLLFTVAAFASRNDPEPVGAVFGVIFLVWGLLNLATGVGLWTMREYGRILQIIFACIGLLAIPVGTIIAIFILIYMLKPGVKVLFSGKQSVEELTPEEAEALRGLAGGGAGSGVLIAVILVFVFIAFMGIVAAIAIPNLLTAMQRAKQKRTMADMRAISTQVEMYKESNNKLPDSIASFKYTKDGWGKELRYKTDGEHYWVVSAAKDGVFETDPENYPQKTTTNFDADIVLRDNEWVQAPEGAR